MDNGMNRKLAALRPSIADQVQYERLASSLSRPTPVPKILDPLAERPARAAFLNQASQIQDEAQAENERNGKLGEAIWREV